jgi:tetratricopeptide (TPR) repeat protein
LIDVLPEEQNLWADTYDRPMTDVRIMYSEMARTIADKTQVNLTAEEMTRLTSASQINPESYDAFLKGFHHYDKGTPEGQKLGLQYFDLAIEIDPNNALAYAGIADVWIFRYQLGVLQRQEAISLITTPLEKALELDNTLAYAYVAMGAYRCWTEWDLEGAEKAYLQALRLDPNRADAHQVYSHLLCFMGRTEEALPHIELGLKLNPLDSIMYQFYGVVLAYHHRYDDAIAAYRTAMELDPNHRRGLGGVAENLDSKGKHDEAFAIYRERYADDAERTKAFEDGFEKAGYKGAYRALADLEANWYGKPGKRVGAQGVATWYLRAGDYDLAIDWFEKAYEDHNPNMLYIGEPSKDPLRSYPRFQDLLRKMNLPVEKENKGT